MSDQKVEKEVTVVAYAKNKRQNMRDWAEELSGLDMQDTYETEEHYWELKVVTIPGEGEEGIFRETLHDYNVDGEQMEKLESQYSGDISVKEVTDKKTHHTNSLYDASQEAVLKAIQEECPEEISGGAQFEKIGLHWKKDKELPVNIRSRTFDKRRVLAKESEREGDDLYQTMAEYPSLQFRVVMTADDREQLDTWTDEVITNLHKGLSKNEAVGEVRYMSCTVTEQREGECYNI